MYSDGQTFAVLIFLLIAVLTVSSIRGLFGDKKIDNSNICTCECCLEVVE